MSGASSSKTIPRPTGNVTSAMPTVPGVRRAIWIGSIPTDSHSGSVGCRASGVLDRDSCGRSANRNGRAAPQTLPGGSVQPFRIARATASRRTGMASMGTMRPPAVLTTFAGRGSKTARSCRRNARESTKPTENGDGSQDARRRGRSCRRLASRCGRLWGTRTPRSMGYFPALRSVAAGARFPPLELVGVVFMAPVASGNHIAGHGWISASADFIDSLAVCWSWWD